MTNNLYFFMISLGDKMLVNMNQMLKKAKEEHYAVPHFNINNLEWTKFILEECNELNVPVIFSSMDFTLNQKLVQKIKRTDFLIQDSVQAVTNSKLYILAFADFMNIFTGNRTFRKVADFSDIFN